MCRRITWWTLKFIFKLISGFVSQDSEFSWLYGGGRGGEEKDEKGQEGREGVEVCKSKSLLEGQNQIIEWFLLEGALNFLPSDMVKETFL